MQDLRAIRFIEGTKVSHDYEGSNITTFSYRDLVERKSPAIGIPCKPNRLIVIDVDVPGINHKHDGRPFWNAFVKEHDLAPTYSVSTQSGGFHFYYKLPEAVNDETFAPPKELSPGVDVKWNGWVGAPPSAGYQVVFGNLTQIQEAPRALMDLFATIIAGRAGKTYEEGEGPMPHSPFSESQIKFIKDNLPYICAHVALSRDEWRDGIFSIYAGCTDESLAEELITQWCKNQAYVPGDEDLALDMARRSKKNGAVGPATVLGIIKKFLSLHVVPTAAGSKWTVEEIVQRSGVPLEFDGKGNKRIETSETNASLFIGAVYDTQELYHDSRVGLHMFRGKSCSDSELVNQFMPLLQDTNDGLGMGKFRKGQIAAGLEILMAKRFVDPHLEYLKGLKWDGTPRIHKFFTDYVGAVDSEYTHLIGTNFWTSLAARGLRPGCKIDSMVVLEGHEGIAKSSLVEAVGGVYTFAPSRKDALENLDELRKMHQSVIVELPELMGLMGESAEKVKAVLSKPFDHIRGLYDKMAKKHDRSFIFVGTTNNERYLTAAMGHRRFWPIRIPRSVKSIKLARILADRDQLFAEGIARFYEGHEYWAVPSHLLDPVVQARLLDEPLIGPIKELIAHLRIPWTTQFVYRELAQNGYVTKGYTAAIVNRIEGALSRLGHEVDEFGYWAHADLKPFSLDDLL